MIVSWPKYLLMYVFLVLFQVLILNNIQFSGYINPYMYVLFILLLPFEIPSWLLLLFGFVLGLSMDLFTHTIGMHTSATVIMAFLRPYVLNLFAPRDGYETGTYPRISYYGLSWFFKYAAILVFLHHFVLFYLEIFRLSEFFATFFRVIASSIVSLVFIILSQYVVFRK
jgi:rod shape-determining protein MreD